MYYLDISFTHKNTDISIRERLSFDINKKREILRLLGSNLSFIESLVLNTCNRCEIFAYVNELDTAKNYAIKILSILSGVAASELEKRADIYYESGAIHHLFSVASSLDSLVVGETQIVGQLRDALNFALSNGACATYIDRALQFAFKCAAKVRNETSISKNPISVSSVAVAKAKEIFGSLQNRSVVVVGAGEMARLACLHLFNAGAKITIVNRDESRAQRLINEISPSKINISYAPFSELKKHINQTQLIFSATASPVPIITDAQISPLNLRRYFFDIAVPRDIEISENELIKVYSVDDLQEIVKINLSLREEQAQIAYAIIGKQTQEFFAWLRKISSIPVIKALRFRAKEIAEMELKKAVKKGYLRHSDLDESRKLIHQIFKAFLHTPTLNLKEFSDQEEFDLQVSSVLAIFDLKDKFDEFSKNLEYTEKNSEI